MNTKEQTAEEKLKYLLSCAMLGTMFNAQQGSDVSCPVCDAEETSNEESGE